MRIEFFFNVMAVDEKRKKGETRDVMMIAFGLEYCFLNIDEYIPIFTAVYITVS